MVPSLSARKWAPASPQVHQGLDLGRLSFCICHPQISEMKFLASIFPAKCNSTLKLKVAWKQSWRGRRSLEERGGANRAPLELEEN